MNRENEKLPLFFTLKQIVGFNGHSFYDGFDPSIKQILLILKTLPLIGVYMILLQFNVFLRFLFLKALKHVAVSLLFGDVERLLRNHRDILLLWGLKEPFSEYRHLTYEGVLTPDAEIRLTNFIKGMFAFFITVHLCIYDQK